LRRQFTFFEYQSYSFQINKQKLTAEFVFNLAGKYLFRPTISIPSRDFFLYDQLYTGELENIVFHIGMVELISYWKAACSPKVIIKPFNLDEEQVNWWKKLYFNGLGEFFYLNGIETNQHDFMEIVSEGQPHKPSKFPVTQEAVIVPVGGGKDSVVTLELLHRNDMNVLPMVVNPGKASERSIRKAGLRLKESIVVERNLDVQLFTLNDKGFLNGHTPFSALLAFISILTSAVSGVKYIALSNESSANESTVPGTNINHQYSKSFEFEEYFNWYLNKYIHQGVRYFSFLRPLNELQIARQFARFQAHFKSFRSCNVGSKTDSWCGSCPKCMFTYIILSPYLKQRELVDIFSKNLLDDLTLRPILDELTGKAEVKPFECVGTTDEVQAALWNAFSKDEKRSLPQLVSYFFESAAANTNVNDFSLLLNQFDNNNFIPDNLLPILKNELGK